MAGVRFRPGMAGEFLCVSPAQLTDRTVPLEDLLGPAARRLQARLADTAAADRAGVLSTFLGIPPAPADPVRRAIAAMVEARGVADLDWVAAQSNLSPRQFRRRCLEASGLAPKHLCRVLRFRYAARWPKPLQKSTGRGSPSTPATSIRPTLHPRFSRIHRRHPHVRFFIPPPRPFFSMAAYRRSPPF